MVKPEPSGTNNTRTWHDLPRGAVLETVRAEPERGLSAEQVSTRLSAAGPNELPRPGRSGAWRILSRQFRSVMVVVLLAATLVSFWSRDYLDAGAILAMLLLTALLGFRQEYAAERGMAALERLAAPAARVLRDGVSSTVAARDLVTGDIVFIEAGGLVPADLRLLEVHALRTDESPLTGESLPVEKDATFIGESGTALGDRLNMAYLGTTVTSGRGRGVVVATGWQTEMGRISSLLERQTPRPTPLQRGIEQVGRKLVLIALAVVGIVFIQGLIRGEEKKTLLLTAISLAVAAVPEGLPAVIAIALAVGSQRMLARRALVRRLAAIETLGSVTVICSDKTGTLTQNRLTVKQAYVDGNRDGLGSIHEPDSPSRMLIACAALSTDVARSGVAENPAEARWTGDPTEIALVRAATEAGMDKESMERLLPRVSELPFDSGRKRMTTVHRIADSRPFSPLIALGPETTHIAITKGALEGLLPRLTRIWSRGSIEPLTPNGRAHITKVHDRMAAEGMRVLGVAFKPLPRAAMLEDGELESDLVFVGFVGLLDPPRPEARDAVALCKQAGITPVMVTGDHPLTAQRIARELGIGNGTPALAGHDLRRLSSEGDLNTILDTAVVARVSPEDKLALVEALQRAGHVVAMTGDGVNDAPALLRADVGVAMGCIGTDAAREASDLVLQDDNFATIVAAVQEGRLIASNIRKFIRYLLSCNSGELWLVLLAPLFGMPLPLTPLQILWINLVTDGFPALALAAEPVDPEVMRRPPRSPKQELLGTLNLVSILASGLLLGLVAFLSGFGYWRMQRFEWQTIVFVIVVFSQLGMAVGCRSELQSVFKLGLFSNRSMIYAVAATAVLQLIVVYVPFAQRIFGSKPLGAGSLIVSLAVSSIPFLGLELGKWLLRRRAGPSGY